ncbi:MAG: ArsR/SmtB family transcription factor [Bacillota bacterium]
MKKLAEFFRALSDETRLKILHMLSSQEMCVCEIIDRLQMSQPAVSHHLKILRQAGLVNDNRDGKWIYYSINAPMLEMYFASFTNVFNPVQENLRIGFRQSRARHDPKFCEELVVQNRKRLLAPLDD